MTAQLGGRSRPTVGGMRREAARDQRVIGVRIVHEVGCPSRGTRCRELAQAVGNSMTGVPTIARTCMSTAVSATISGKKVLVAEAGRAALSISATASSRAVTDHFGADPAALGRPDRLREPLLERQVVGEAPQQRHCGVGVGVDEARDEHVSGRSMTAPGA